MGVNKDRNVIYNIKLNEMTIKEIKRQTRGVFLQPKILVYFGKQKHGTPYFFPRNYIGSIIAIRKSRIVIGWPICVRTVGLWWKDKFGSPRYEWPPQFHIFFFGLQFCMWWVSPKINGKRDDDLYYEMILWYLNYCDKDINLSKKSWDWIDSDTKKSTWNDGYLC